MVGSEYFERRFGAFPEQLHHVSQALAVQLALDLARQAVGHAMHGDELEEVLQFSQGLLGVLDDAQVQAKAMVIRLFRGRVLLGTVDVIDHDHRITADVLGSRLEDLDRLFPGQYVNRVLRMVVMKQGYVFVEDLGDRPIPAGIDQEDVKSWSFRSQWLLTNLGPEFEPSPRRGRGVGSPIHLEGPA